MQFMRDILPSTIEFISDRLLIWFLALLFLVELLGRERGNSPIARRLASFGKDIQRFIVTTAETGAIIALANLFFLSLLGVDFAVIWCLLHPEHWIYDRTRATDLACTPHVGLEESAARVILLDQTLALYGPEVKEVRDQLRSGVEGIAERIEIKKSAKPSQVRA